jgi:predicted metal-dependent hydrolase
MSSGKHDLLLEGLKLFNSRRYFDAHEAWEDLWRESTGEERQWIQGLVQIAVALHHHSSGNHTGAVSVMKKARHNLAGCSPMFRRLDIERLRNELDALQEELASGSTLRIMQIGLVTTH